MKIEGYGEDSLTLVALKTPAICAEILKEFPAAHRSSQGGTGLMYYRPSFGRGGKKKDGEAQANFGEFDAIVAEPGRVVLVESKWSPSDLAKMYIHPHQVRRHAVFQIYLEELFAPTGARKRSVDEAISAAKSRLKTFEFGAPDITDDGSLISNLRRILGAIQAMQAGTTPLIHHLALNFPYKVSPNRTGVTTAHKLGEGVTAEAPGKFGQVNLKFRRIDVLRFKGEDFVDLV